MNKYAAYCHHYNLLAGKQIKTAARLGSTIGGFLLPGPGAAIGGGAFRDDNDPYSGLARAVGSGLGSAIGTIPGIALGVGPLFGVGGAVGGNLGYKYLTPALFDPSKPAADAGTPSSK